MEVARGRNGEEVGASALTVSIDELTASGPKPPQVLTNLRPAPASRNFARFERLLSDREPHDDLRVVVERLDADHRADAELRMADAGAGRDAADAD